jgi:hypothetical protein
MAIRHRSSVNSDSEACAYRDGSEWSLLIEEDIDAKPIKMS